MSCWTHQGGSPRFKIHVFVPGTKKMELLVLCRIFSLRAAAVFLLSFLLVQSLSASSMNISRSIR